MLNRGGPLSKIVSGTIGLAKEYGADKKARKAPAQDNDGNSTTASTPQHVENHHKIISEEDTSDDSEDDSDWILDLDEAQALQASTNFGTQDSTANDFDIDHMATRFANTHTPPPAKLCGLSMNVLLPQRRPTSQHKGFVRAYAPVLEECGIDQQTWLDFLDGLEKSISKNSWFHVTNAGILMTGTVSAATMGISPVLHMASMAIHTSIELSRRAYLNHQQNRYLDNMNEKFFKPRGLFCMVIKYIPSSNDILGEVNFQDNVSRSIEMRDGSNKWKRIVSSSGITVGSDLAIPAPAPLIFPELDKMSAQQKENSIKRFGHVMQDYMDRRAAATFEAKNPGSNLPAAPRKEFASQYGDPNSAANSGGFISLATGGKWNPVGPSGPRHDMRRERKEARKDRMKGRREKRPMSKMLKSEAMYLMVTNLPSQKVLDRVGAELERSTCGFGV